MKKKKKMKVTEKVELPPRKDAWDKQPQSTP